MQIQGPSHSSPAPTGIGRAVAEELLERGAARSTRGCAIRDGHGPAPGAGRPRRHRRRGRRRSGQGARRRADRRQQRRHRPGSTGSPPTSTTRARSRDELPRRGPRRRRRRARARRDARRVRGCCPSRRGSWSLRLRRTGVEVAAWAFTTPPGTELKLQGTEVVGVQSASSTRTLCWAWTSTKGRAADGRDVRAPRAPSAGLRGRRGRSSAHCEGEPPRRQRCLPGSRRVRTTRLSRLAHQLHRRAVHAAAVLVDLVVGDGDDLDAGAAQQLGRARRPRP